MVRSVRFFCANKHSWIADAEVVNGIVDHMMVEGEDSCPECGEYVHDLEVGEEEGRMKS